MGPTWHWLWRWLLVVVIAAAVAAALLWPKHAVLQSTQPTPAGTAERFIAEMGDRTVAALAMQGDTQARNDAFAGLMIEAIDFDALAFSTLGKMARTVSAKNKREFTLLFAAHVIDVAVERFGNIQINRFSVGAARPQPNGDVKVNTLIDRRGDQPLSVDWRVRNRAGKPKISDIEVEGYSLAIHYRGEFERAEVSTVPGLINRLQSMTKNSVSLPTVRRAF